MFFFSNDTIIIIVVIVVVVNAKGFFFVVVVEKVKKEKLFIYFMPLILCLGSYFKNDFNKNKVNFGVIKILVK